MLKKLAIYPVNEQIMPILRNAALAGYEVRATIAPKAWGYCGKDAGFVDGGPETGLIVSDDSRGSIEAADAVFIGCYSEDISKHIYTKIINQCLHSGKVLIVTQKVKEYLATETINWSEISILRGNSTPVIKREELGILPINVPVILVTGAGEMCDKFNLQLTLREYFTNRGLRVLQYGTKDYAELFGFMPLPDFLYVPNDFSTKILALNHYLHSETREFRPDILIIGIPGGVSCTALKEPRNFGELSLVISNAVYADICVMSLYSDDYTKKYLDEMRVKINHRLNVPNCYFHVSNKKFLFNFESYMEHISFLTGSIPMRQHTDEIFNIHDKAAQKVIFDNIYSMLAGTMSIVG